MTKKSINIGKDCEEKVNKVTYRFLSQRKREGAREREREERKKEKHILKTESYHKRKTILKPFLPVNKC